MNVPQSTDLVGRLRAHANRDNCVSHDWGGEHVDAGEDCVTAANEIERLRADIESLKAYTGVYSQGWRSRYARETTS